MRKKRTHSNKKRKKPLRLLSWDDLRARGIKYHSNHLRWLWNNGLFPKPIHLSPRKLVWDADEVDEWLAARINKRAAS